MIATRDEAVQRLAAVEGQHLDATAWQGVFEAVDVDKEAVAAGAPDPGNTERLLETYELAAVPPGPDYWGACTRVLAILLGVGTAAGAAGNIVGLAAAIKAL